jgi:uncharacterized membrane protein YgaE (UPF0421/DUF939 family)
MKHQLIALAIVGLSAGVIFSGCNNPPEKKIEEAREDLHESEMKAEKDKLEAENKYQEEYLKFKNEQEEKLKENEAELARYKENSAKVKKSEKADYDAKVTSLEERNRNLRVRIDEYDREADQEKKRSGWEDFKREFNHDMEELGNAFRDLGKNNEKDKDNHK